MKFSYRIPPTATVADAILTFQMSRDAPEFQQLTNLRCVRDPTLADLRDPLQRLSNILGRRRRIYPPI